MALWSNIVARSSLEIQVALFKYLQIQALEILDAVRKKLRINNFIHPRHRYLILFNQQWLFAPASSLLPRKKVNIEIICFVLYSHFDIFTRTPRLLRSIPLEKI